MLWRKLETTDSVTIHTEPRTKLLAAFFLNLYSFVISRSFRWGDADGAWNWQSRLSSSVSLNSVVSRYKTCWCFALFQEMPDGGLCNHGQHQRVPHRGTSRHGAHVAQRLSGRLAVHPHNSYGGKSWVCELRDTRRDRRGRRPNTVTARSEA